MKKNSGPSFTSFRILGEKAQKLFARARQLHDKGAEHRSAVKLPPQQELPEIIVHLSTTSVAKATLTVLAIGVGALLVWLLQDKIVILLLGIFVAVITDPGVKAMKRIGIPRGVAIILLYVIALFLLLFLIVSLIPIIAKQLIDLAGLVSTQVDTFLSNPKISLPLMPTGVNESMTHFLESSLRSLSVNKFTDALAQFGQSLATTAQGSLLFAAHIAGSVVNFFVNLVLVLVLAFFFQIEKEKIIGWFRSFLPWSFRAYVDDKTEVIHWKLAQWARGQLILCLSIAVLVFIALTILRMPYALTLAILAGFTEFIPVIGPFMAAVPAVLIAMTQNGFVWGLVIAAVYYVIQWCENNLLVPLIMKRAVGLSAIAIMFAMLVGVSFPDVVHPILGIMLSIPVTTILALFLEDYRELRMRKRAGA